MNEIASLFWPHLLRGTVILSVTCIVVICVLRLLRVSSPTLHRIAWCAVLLQGCLISSFTLPIPWHDPLSVSALPAPMTIPEMPLSDVPNTDIVVTTLEVDAPAELPAVIPAEVKPEIKTSPVPTSVWFLLVWIAGMLVAVVRWTAGYAWFLRSLKPITTDDETWQAEWRELQTAQNVRRPLPLIITAAQGPMLCRLPQGFAVIVPETLWRSFAASQRRAVLRHELAHYLRGDALKSLAMRLLALPHWFNPLAWWTVRRFDEAAEWACDDAAVDNLGQSPTSFAKTLLELGTVAAPPLTHSPAASGHSLARRIRRMLSASPTQDQPWKKTLVLLVGIFAVLLNVIRLELVAKAAPPTNPSAELATDSGDAPLAKEAEAPAPAAQKTLKAKLPKAVQGGIDYLFSQQQTDGHWSNGDENSWVIGVTSLCTFALLESGVTADEPRVSDALDYLRKQKPTRTYEVALQTLALCAAGAKQDLATIQRNVVILESGHIQRGPGQGTWSYGTGNRLNMAGGDSSNSEFAIWALDAAANAGVQVKPETWKLAYDHWSKSQLAEGGWGYRARSPATGSMTCSGIASLVICHRRVFKDDQDDAPDLKKMLAPSLEWMAKNFAVGLNPQQLNWQLYYMMVLRNAGELSGIQRFGEHSWYAEGSFYLSERQSKKTGAWNGAGQMEDELVSTAMALLFLKAGPPKVVAETSAVESAEGDSLAARKAAVDELNKLGLRYPLEVGDGKRPYFEVELSGSSVIDADLVHLKDLGGMLNLKFEKTQITDAGLMHVMPLSGLRLLWVQNSKITVAGLRELWRVMPRLQVVEINTIAEGDPGTAKKLLRETGDALIAAAAAREASKPRTPVEKEIYAALKARDDTVKSFRFVWTERHTDHKGSQHSIEDRTRVALGQDTSYTWTTEMAVDGKKMLYSFSGKQPTYDASGEAEFIERRYLSGFNGREMRSASLYPGSSKITQGFLRPANRSDDVVLASTNILRWLYCTFDPTMTNTNWQSLEVVKEPAEVRGHRCWELRRRYEGINPGAPKVPSASWWVDPSREYVIVRYAYSNSAGMVQSQLDIDYQQDDKHGWVPSLWRFRRFDRGGKVLTTTISRVTEYEINPQLDDDIFTLQFPPGTHMN
ncbi:Regulatory protein BlaR1 [Symmachiella dynata]|uniref:M56 family metallopeptidase n=1 Tax=Symmachiella dynata TaxID=2527995 RepID=UPI00118BA3BC|nr:M56 family metallopeptidase [Symmachiella dynata]QDT46819.1 Regulatory protein BlaR1 [Symmachiella dynata]